MADVALQQLFTLFQNGCHAQMAQRARELLAARPDDGPLWKALSVAQQMLGQDALPALRRAMQLLPQDAELAANLGALLAARGQWGEACAAYEQALRLQPGLAGAHNNLGNALLALQQPARALGAFDTALRLQPGLVAALGNRARALLALGRPGEAAQAFVAAVAAQPADATLREHAATALDAAGRRDDALAQLRVALQLAPQRVDAWFLLGEWLQQRGDEAGAAQAWEQVLAREAGHAEAACNLARLRPARGEAVLGSVLAAGVSGERRAAVLASLCSLRLAQDRYTDAVAACREALASAPASPQAVGNLAQALKRQGRLDEADTLLTRLIAEHPAVLTARSDRLLLRAYRGDDPAALRAEATDFGRAVAAPAVARAARATGGRAAWRVGLVSADLRQHPVGRLAQAWLPALAARCELFVYAGAQDTLLTPTLRAVVPRWLDVADLDDAALATRIAADRIDVLVDLHGHTGGQRQGVFARRPAPRQFSWLGYAGSTGLAEMDGFVGDRWLLPDGAEAGFVEPLKRLPHSFTVYAPPASAPAVALLGAVPRFGCFNALHKLSDEVLALWARLLVAAPGSRLLLKAPGLQHDAERAALRARWPGDAARLDLEGPGPLADYLAAFARVDIALDPSPYSGGMTTLDGLWMGVPVLTQPGAAPISRQGLSFLQTLGLADGWVASDADDFVRLAALRLQDRAALARLRAGLRERMAASPLCDAGRFAADWLALLTA